MPLMIFIGWAIRVYSYVILARVILDWLMMTRGSWRFSAVRNLLWAVTEPVLSPIRRLLDPYQRRSRLDFSPLILIVLLHVLARALMRVPM
jgi:uncharacterized protein YggT (Ycf19 family)